MAEYCLDCFNQVNGTKLTDKEVIIEEDVCEGCNKVKPCVMSIDRGQKMPFNSFLKWLGITGI